MKPRARLAALLRPKLRTPSPAQRVQNPYRRLYPGRAQVDAEKCVLCGYCAGVCPQVCIKVV